MEFKRNGPSMVNFEMTLVEFGHWSVDELFAHSPFDQPSYRCASRFPTEEKENFISVISKDTATVTGVGGFARDQFKSHLSLVC